MKRIRDDVRDHGYPQPQIEETGFLTAAFYPNPEVRAQTEAGPGGIGTVRVPS